MDGEALEFDQLVIATGAKTSHFGHADWEPYAASLKSLEDAVEIRRRGLTAFERAERETDEHEREALLTFVVIGGGPTGIELGGAIAALSPTVHARDFRAIHPEKSRVLLIEAGDRILSAFDPSFSSRAEKSLESLGAQPRTKSRVAKIDATGVRLEDGGHIAARRLGEAVGLPVDKQGRVIVNRECSPKIMTTCSSLATARTRKRAARFCRGSLPSRCNNRHRIVVLLHWTWSYVFYKRGARLITARVANPDA